jgi:hypothetical protein
VCTHAQIYTIVELFAREVAAGQIYIPTSIFPGAERLANMGLRTSGAIADAVLRVISPSWLEGVVGEAWKAAGKAAGRAATIVAENTFPSSKRAP